MDERDDKGRFAPGNPGGPGRPPKKRSITHLLRELGEEELDDGETREQKAARAMWEMALGGDKMMLQYIRDALDGKATQTQIVETVEPPKFIRFDYGDDESDSETTGSDTEPA